MLNYEIFTDSCCDLPKEMTAQYDIKVLELEVLIDDKPPMLNKDVEIKEFYNLLRNGSNAKTAAVTPGSVEDAMKKSLLEGKDILYLGFSSGLSATYNNCAMMMKELREEFPNQELIDVDTLGASLGQGLMVYYAALLRESGASIEEVRDKIESIKHNLHHEVMAEDLFFLSRGGRISTATAIAGSVLKIKPMIHMDKEGHLVNYGKIRGRKAGIKELYSKMKNDQNLKELNYVFICHSDCYEDASSLADMVKADFPDTPVTIGYIGPVIGAHTGPGTMAIFYLGNQEKGQY